MAQETKEQEQVGKEGEEQEVPIGETLKMGELFRNPEERWTGKERAIEIQAIQLQQTLQEGDLVDVRIRYPNGEEYIVIAKRGCYEVVVPENRMTMWLLEDEMLRLSSSIVDCAAMNGTLYVVRYRRDLSQKTSKVTYIPKAEVCELLQQDPDIVSEAEGELLKKQRKRLEESINMMRAENMGVDWEQTKQTVEEKEQEEVVYFD